MDKIASSVLDFLCFFPFFQGWHCQDSRLTVNSKPLQEKSTSFNQFHLNKSILFQIFFQILKRWNDRGQTKSLNFKGKVGYFVKYS